MQLMYALRANGNKQLTSLVSSHRLDQLGGFLEEDRHHSPQSVRAYSRVFWAQEHTIASSV